ncbi:hypothetical protein ACU4GD_33430 [Cupriavidus basilensis]
MTVAFIDLDHFKAIQRSLRPPRRRQRAAPLQRVAAQVGAHEAISSAGWGKNSAS